MSSSSSMAAMMRFARHAFPCCTAAGAWEKVRSHPSGHGILQATRGPSDGESRASSGVGVGKTATRRFSTSSTAFFSLILAFALRCGGAFDFGAFGAVWRKTGRRARRAVHSSIFALRSARSAARSASKPSTSATLSIVFVFFAARSKLWKMHAGWYQFTRTAVTSARMRGGTLPTRTSSATNTVWHRWHLLRPPVA